MEPSRPLRVRFGPFELNLKTAELTDDKQTMQLQRQPFTVLMLLLESAGDLVEREEIKRKLWPNDTEVDFDHSINAAIRNLRRVLGDSAENPEYIETLTGKGYRLIVPVEWLPGAIGETTQQNSGSDERLPAGDLTGRKVSHYRILGIIGGGGMGVVYKAEDLRLARRVAIKFLPEEVGSDPRALERFELEARTASSLDHPNICHIYAFGDHDGQPFMVMQLLEGRTLRDRITVAESDVPSEQDGKCISLEEALDLASQILSGLAAAHAKEIIHRDIKPANIFVTNGGTAKILDFGLAKLLRAEEEAEVAPQVGSQSATAPVAEGSSTPSLSRAGVAMGTAGYMSPEQLRGDQLDVRTDLFSFGVVLYEMVTGHKAFGGENITLVHDAILNSSPLPPLQANPDLPRGLEEIINKCLQKERELRYQTADELAADLRTVIHDIQAKRIAGTGIGQVWGKDITSRILKMSRSRHVMLGVFAIALLIGIFFGIRLYQQKDKRDIEGPVASVAILPYYNESGDPSADWIGPGISETLIFDFGDPAHLRVIPPERLQQALRDLHISPESVDDLYALQHLAKVTHADSIVSGRYQRIGEQLRIKTTVLNLQPKPYRFVEMKRDVPAERELASTVDTLMVEICKEFILPPEVLRDIEADTRHVSILAVHAYDEGRQLAANGNNTEATNKFEEATSYTPDFAVAYSGMAESYAALGSDEKAEQASQRAVELSPKLPPREEYLIQATHARIFSNKAKMLAYGNLSTGAMRLRPIDYILWLAPPVLQAGTLLAFYKRRLFRPYPFFFGYILLGALQEPILFSMHSLPEASYYAYWCALGISTVISVLVIIEIVGNVWPQQLALPGRLAFLVCTLVS